ncbi:Scr1 family TA system antitoxin-like transcriptional regulator [Streptomyces sp. NPDC058171]
MSQRNATGETGTITSAGMFGEVLRHFRKAADYTQEGLAADIPCDRSLVTRVESATRVPQDNFARRCDELLSTGGVLIKLWGKVNWYPEVEHPDWFQRRVDMEAIALALRSYQTQVIPGLLQTEEYAQVLFSRVASRDRTAAGERTRARMSRQQRFLSPDGPLYTVVLDESCLRNVVGGTTTMRAQLRHLLAVGQLPNIRIQVALADQARLIRPNTSMSLISLPGGENWAYSESMDSGHFSNDPVLFARHSQTYDVLRADVLSAPASAAWITEVSEGYGLNEQARSHRSGMDQEQPQRGQRRGLHRGSPRYPRLRPRR